MTATSEIKKVTLSDVEPATGSKDSLPWRVGGTVLIFTTLAVTYISVVRRTPWLESKSRIPAIESAYRGITIESAFIILALGITFSYLLLRSVKGMLRRNFASRMSARHRLLKVDITTALPMMSAAVLPIDSYSLAAPAPWPFLPSMVAATTSTPRCTTWRAAPVPLATAGVVMLLELALLGHWGA